MVKTIPFDAALFFTSPEAQRGLLDDAFDSGNTAYITNALGVIAKARGMTAVAREAGEGLYKALSEDGDLSPDDAAGRGAGAR
ncbi:MAG: addiction module antidote protein [Aliidongia sp.]